MEQQGLNKLPEASVELWLAKGEMEACNKRIHAYSISGRAKGDELYDREIEKLRTLCNEFDVLLKNSSAPDEHLEFFRMVVSAFRNVVLVER